MEEKLKAADLHGHSVDVQFSISKSKKSDALYFAGCTNMTEKINEWWKISYAAISTMTSG